jgi:DNA invertase Pin-like site-specific DNA recombinase
MKIGYARVSTKEQNLNRQTDALKKAGCELIFQEKTSGMNKDRTEFLKMIGSIRPGDIIIVDELSRFSRGTAELFQLVESLNSKNVSLVSLTEPWMNTTSATGQLLFTIFAGLAQFERACTMERSERGRIAARSRGVKFGRPNTD